MNGLVCQFDTDGDGNCGYVNCPACASVPPPLRGDGPVQSRLPTSGQNDPVIRAAILEAWSRQDAPRVLAPTSVAGERWLALTRDAGLIPGLTSKQHVVLTAQNLETATRGFTGPWLVVLRADGPHAQRMYAVLNRTLPFLRGVSTWTEEA